MKFNKLILSVCAFQLSFLTLTTLFCQESPKNVCDESSLCSESKKTALTLETLDAAAEIIALAEKKGLEVTVYEDFDNKGEEAPYISFQVKRKNGEITQKIISGAFFVAICVAAYFALPSLVKKCLSEEEEAS